MNSPSLKKFAALDLLQFGKSLLAAAGLAEDRAQDVGEILLEGDLMGHTTHGFALLPAYLNALQDGSMEKLGEPVTIADHASALTWDGCYLPGPWMIRRAISMARERVAIHPVVTVVIRRSHHIGCLQAYLKPLTDEGLMILLSCSDPACRLVAPHGGKEPRLSPNPIAAGIPTNGDPILIDISSSTTAHAICRRLAQDGQRLPENWVMDRNGNPSNDPSHLFNDAGGSLLPLGGLELGHKGFALALLVEALTNALAGFGRADEETRWGASVFLQIINPNCFGGRENFLRETSFLAQSCIETPSLPGKSPVRLPGQAALAKRAEQLAHGISLHPTIMPALTSLAEKLKVKLPPAI